MSLSQVQGGIYGGAIGYISWNGNIDTAIAIRTAVIRDNKIHVGAGAGIVADSDPEKEWRNVSKIKSIFRCDGDDFMIIVIDNYDSFTYNLVHYIGELEQDIKVIRNDEMSVSEIMDNNPSKIVISPGPCTPKEAGISVELIKTAEVPILEFV